VTGPGPSPRQPEAERHVALEGAFNFRDAGGYRAAGGRRVATGRLFRSDGLGGLTPADLAVLDHLGLRTVIDLRTVDEVERRGRFAWPGRTFAYHHLPMLDVLPDQESYARGWATTEGVAAAYAAMLDGAAPAVAAALSVVADPGSAPTVVHCAAGKDRTGLLVAITLGLLGVADDDIADDYALSGAAMERWLAWMRASDPDRAAQWESSAAAVVHAEVATMHAVLAAVRARHGDLEGFAAAIGVPGVGARLRAALLEP
jgi:protein-tyrosine phosphatase